LANYREISLPFAGKSIRQDVSAQGVSLAAQLLYNAAVAAVKDETLRMLELGCGCGIVSIMCALSRPAWQITGIDIQPHLITLARANAAACAVESRFEQGDILNWQGEYDLILANPPWQKAGHGILSAKQSRRLSRVELACTLPDVIQALKRCLAPTGLAILIYPLMRAQELNAEIDNTFLDIIRQDRHLGKKPYITTLIKIQE
jgi:tRNA1(Val) A37 N6-methylase TrmN6